MKIINVNGNTAVYFRSIPLYYMKEECGVKKNTVRIVNELEDEQIKQSNATHVYIDDIVTEQYFIRELSDITRFIYNNIIIYIFSWK